VSFFRNLFSWRIATPTKADPAPVPPPAPATPQPPAHRPVATQLPPEPIPVTGDLIPFPLKAITDLFPAELKPAIRKQPSEHVQIQIPRALIEPQLATGAVRLTFAELRGFTPEIFFHPEAPGADTKLQLPLQMVIARIKPARRDGQRQQAVPTTIPSVFGKAGAVPAPGPAPSGAEAWYTPRRPTSEPKPEPPAAATPAPAPKPSAPAPAPTAAAPAIPAPAVIPAPPIIPEPPQPAPPPAAIAMPAPPPPVAAVPIPDPAPAPAQSADSLTILVQSIAPALSAEIQAAFAGAGAQTFVIPISEFEPRMRTGRLRFKWSELQGWCVPPSSSSDAADMDVDLPMASVVPLFLAVRNTADRRKKIEIDSRIPDVFGKANAPVEPAAAEPAPVIPPAPVAPPPPPPEPPAAAPEPAPAPATSWESRPLRIEHTTVPPEPEPVAPLVPEPAAELTPAVPAPVIQVEHIVVPDPVIPAEPAIPAPPAIPPAPAIQTNGPADAVRRIRELDNVTGAFVATADGLLVAADLPDGNATILAAFAPTVFSQLSKFTEMAKLGRPEAVELHLGLTTIHLRKTGKLYLGILMPAGHSFPLAALAPISSSLQPH